MYWGKQIYNNVASLQFIEYIIESFWKLLNCFAHVAYTMTSYMHSFGGKIIAVGNDLVYFTKQDLSTRKQSRSMQFVWQEKLCSSVNQ